MRYLTAQTALNVPSETGQFVDWHLLEAFGGSPADWQARCTWAGEGNATPVGRQLPDTRTWLGDSGVWDCTEVLRCHGVQVPPGQIVHAARPWRAVLDMVLAHAAKGRVAQHIQLSQWFDPQADAKVLSQLQTAALNLLGEESSNAINTVNKDSTQGVQSLPDNLRPALAAWLQMQTEICL